MYRNLTQASTADDVAREHKREEKAAVVDRMESVRKRRRDEVQVELKVPAPVPEQTTTLPYNPTQPEQRRILQDFAERTSYAMVKELVCAVCGEKHPASVVDGGRATDSKDRLRTRIQVRDLDDELITTLVDTLMHPERKGGTYPCSQLNGLSLDVCGFCSTGGNDETHTSTKIQICTTCYSVRSCDLFFIQKHHMLLSCMLIL